LHAAKGVLDPPPGLWPYAVVQIAKLGKDGKGGKEYGTRCDGQLPGPQARLASVRSDVGYPAGRRVYDFEQTFSVSSDGRHGGAQCKMGVNG
jgi:hypothetical protein